MTPGRRLAIDDRGEPPTPEDFVERVVAAALAHAGRPDLAVSLLLTDDAGMAELHERFLGDPTPTDVLSFPMDEGVEVAVSVETAQRVARAMGHDPRAELALYLVHGLLHVCGHDDRTSSERERMRGAELEVLADLGLRVSPVD